MSETETEFRGIAENVFATIGRPVRSASLWYALYYLVEIEGVAEAAFDFKQERRKQAEAFYQYGRYAMLKEFTNAGDRYIVAGSNLLDLDDEAKREHAFEFLFPDDRVMAEAWLEWVDQRRRLMELMSSRNEVAVQDGLERATRVNRNTPPDEPIETIFKRFFRAMPDLTMTASRARRTSHTGWSRGFDGPAWAAIGEHLERHDELSDTAFVDQSWSVEHNNSNWIDKINLVEDDRETDAVAEIRFDGAAETGAQPSEIGGHADLIRGLQQILDAARESDLEVLFDYAEFFNGDVGVNLRRQRRFLGI